MGKGYTLYSLNPSLKEIISNLAVDKAYFNNQMRRQVEKRYENYLTKGAWKCPISPSGAHYFKLDERGEGKCQFCTKRQKAKVV